jgi:hypothetical protein
MRSSLSQTLSTFRLNFVCDHPSLRAAWTADGTAHTPVPDLTSSGSAIARIASSWLCVNDVPRPGADEGAAEARAGTSSITGRARSMLTS